MGAKVLLVEKSGQLGGTTTLNKVAFPGIFHAWGKQVIGGIGWDLVCRAVEMEGNELPDFSDFTLPHYRHQVPLCPALLSGLIDEEIQKAGCTVLFHVMPATITPRDGGGWKIQLCGKEGLSSVVCNGLIDATGDANAAHLAGCQLRTASASLQPGTLVFILEGYDPEAIDLPTVDIEAGKALEQGLLSRSDFGWGAQSLRHLIRSRGKSAVHIPHIDATDSAGKTQAELEGRAALMRVYRFLKKQPGFEALKISWCAPECGIRETRSIVGRSTITLEDYSSGRKWPDAICYSFYPIDLHMDEGLKYEKLKPGIVPTIPLSAMLPQGVDGLIAAGHCISGDRMANSAFRVQASCMAMGQAAGAAAALAVARGYNDIASVDRRELKAVLEKEGAFFPEA